MERLGSPPSTSPGLVRGRRQVYTSRACQECKRRKVKCNGQTPCSGCNKSRKACIYADRKRTRETLPGTNGEDELFSIRTRLEALESDVAALRQGQAQIQSSSVANQSIWAMPDLEVSGGIIAPEVSRGSSGAGQSNEFVRVSAIQAAQNSRLSIDGASTSRVTIRGHPLLTSSGPEVLRLLDIYEEECGTLYPVVDVDAMRQLATHFYAQTATQRTASSWREVTLDPELQRPLQILMAVLAIAGAISNPDALEFSCALVDAIEAEIDHRPCGVKAETHLVEILFLMSLYQFYRSEDVLAWRTVGLASLIALELGWHLRTPHDDILYNNNSRQHAIQLFWCIYIFDRRCSFNTGLPFSINENEVDPELLEPQETPPYILRSLIAHARLASRIWKATSTTDYSPHSSRKEQAAFFSYQVEEWRRSLSQELQWDSYESPKSNRTMNLSGTQPDRQKHRLRVFYDLQELHLRMLIHRHSLLLSPLSSSLSLAIYAGLPSMAPIADLASARTAITYATKIIGTLTEIHTPSGHHDGSHDRHYLHHHSCNHQGLYKAHQVCFDTFMHAALTMLVITASRADPGTDLAESCRTPMRQAMKILEDRDTDEAVGRKIYDTIKRLRVPVPGSADVQRLLRK